MTIADALDRIRAAGVTLRVDGAALKASGTPLTDAQRAWLRAHKLAVIAELEAPGRCACGRPVDFYGDDGDRLVAFCDGHLPASLRAQLWPEAVA